MPQSPHIDRLTLERSAAEKTTEEQRQRIAALEAENVGLKEEIANWQGSAGNLATECTHLRQERDAALALVEQMRPRLPHYATCACVMSFNSCNCGVSELKGPLPAALQAAGERVKRMTNALGAYANEDHWDYVESGDIVVPASWAGPGRDGWNIAQVALSVPGEKEGEG